MKAVVANIAAVNQLRKERNEALEQIKPAQFVEFLYTYADEIVGYDNRTKRDTTLRDEIKAVASMAHAAYYGDGINYYRSFSARNTVEYSEEELLAKSKRNYLAAGKKILFLSSVCRRLTGDTFLGIRVDKEDLSAMTRLVNAFEWAVVHYDQVVAAARA